MSKPKSILQQFEERRWDSKPISKRCGHVQSIILGLDADGCQLCRVWFQVPNFQKYSDEGRKTARAKQ